MKHENAVHSETSSTSEYLETGKQKLLAFLARLSETAEGFCNRLRLSFLLCLLSASWLTFFVNSLLELSLWSLLPFFLGFNIPALFIWRLRSTLQDVIKLPTIFPAIAGCFKQEMLSVKDDTLNQLNTLNPTKTKRTRLKELAAMARQLLGLKQLLTELRRQLGEFKGDIITSVLVVASPGFVILTGIATISTIALCSVAGISLIIYLLFIG